MDKETARDNLNNAFAFFRGEDGNVSALPKLSGFIFVDKIVFESVWALLGKENCKTGAGYTEVTRDGEHGAVDTFKFSTKASEILAEAGVSIPGMKQRTSSVSPKKF